MSIAEMCALAHLSRAGYYRFLTTPAAGDKDLDLRDAIQRIALEFPAYGRPRMTEELHRRGYILGIIANTITETEIPDWMESEGLTSYFKAVVLSSKVALRKPNPEIFRYVANLWQLAPEDVVMVGDAPKYDILGAHWAGMHGILIDRNEGHWWQQIPDDYSADLKIRPDATVHSLLEIPDILEHW